MPPGIATLTDRVLPDLLPVAGRRRLRQRRSARAVAIESPPPVEHAGSRITSYAALENIAGGNYFEPGVTRRVVVLLTDGESTPVRSRGRQPHSCRRP